MAPSAATPTTSTPIDGHENDGDWAITYIETIAALPTEALHSEQARVANSIKHLLRSNDEIESFVADTTDQAEAAEFKQVVVENQEVVAAQRQRMELITAELKNRTTHR
ncbi:hypothetical protein V1514DRAFT_341085 [Lipomyces japonicus]|uniref:uncharacterized protein n=1 Tax=Lipomyces japonicus TaxID=56871 RepID=UPI0034CF2C13